MTPCWMISLVTPGSVALLEKQPLPCSPWECLLPVWLQAAGANRLRLLFPPMAIISLCPLVDSCSLLLQRDTDYLSLCPLEPLSHRPHLSLSQCGRSHSAPAGRRATDMQEAQWPQLFHCLCFQFSCYCAPSPGSQAATCPLISPPRVRRPWFCCVDLNKICLHLTIRI